MKKYYRIFFFLMALHTKLITPQVMRPPQFNYISRPEAIMESPGNYWNAAPAPTVLSEPPCNSIVPIPNIVNPPSTTIITDCSPTICKNLANTIQLMIVSNLLQNSQDGSEFAMQLAGPIINEVMSSPAFSCPCENPVASELFTSNFFSPGVLPPTMVNNLMPPNVVPTSGMFSSMPQNYFSPTISQSLRSSVAQNMSPSFLPPRAIGTSGVCQSNMMPSNVISGVPNRITSTAPLSKPVSNTNGLLNSLMGLLGNVQGKI